MESPAILPDIERPDLDYHGLYLIAQQLHLEDRP
jgi:hypothetical protein